MCVLFCTCTFACTPSNTHTSPHTSCLIKMHILPCILFVFEYKIVCLVSILASFTLIFLIQYSMYCTFSLFLYLCWHSFYPVILKHSLIFLIQAFNCQSVNQSVSQSLFKHSSVISILQVQIKENIKRMSQNYTVECRPSHASSIFNV